MLSCVLLWLGSGPNLKTVSRASWLEMGQSYNLPLRMKWALSTVDQLMWRTVIHHILRWHEPSPLRDFMRRLWPFTLWTVDCMHAKWQIRCRVWIAGHAVIWEIMRIQSFWGPWKNRQDVVDDSEMYTRGVWRTTFCRCANTQENCQLMKNQTILKAN